MADPAIQIWVWVASFLGSLAQEGEPLDLEAAWGWGRGQLPWWVQLVVTQDAQGAI